MRQMTMPGALLRVEGVVVFAGAVAIYVALGGPWWLFLALLLAPDLSMLGYLAGPRAGSVVYNVFHIYLLPGALLAFGLLGGTPLAAQIAAVWLAHIGMDRTFGYGLKYPSGFKDTHQGRI